MLERNNTALTAENGTLPAYTASEPPVSPTPARSGNNDDLSNMMERVSHMSDMEIAYALLDLRETTQPGSADSVSPLPVPVCTPRASVPDQNSRSVRAATRSNDILMAAGRVSPASQQRVAGTVSTVAKVSASGQPPLSEHSSDDAQQSVFPSRDGGHSGRDLVLRDVGDVRNTARGRPVFERQ